MKNTYITNAIDRNINHLIDESDTRNAAARVLFENWDENQDGVLIFESLNMVIVKWSKGQYKRGSGITTASSFPLSAIITIKAPELPIGNGIYRGRRKDGSFTMIAYYDSVMVDIGCGYRKDIKITDPFWIDLRTIKVTEYESPCEKAEKEREELFNEIMELRAKCNKLETENQILKLNLSAYQNGTSADDDTTTAETKQESNNDDEDLYI